MAFLTVPVTTTGGASGCASEILSVIQDLPHRSRWILSVGRWVKAMERIRWRRVSDVGMVCGMVKHSGLGVPG
jgi:hypothetical protein